MFWNKWQQLVDLHKFIMNNHTVSNSCLPIEKIKIFLGKKRVISGIDSSGAALYTHVRNQDDPRQEQSQESLAERVKRMVAENKGSSISVFINPNDVSRAHFRVDSKFT